VTMPFEASITEYYQQQVNNMVYGCLHNYTALGKHFLITAIAFVINV